MLFLYQYAQGTRAWQFQGFGQLELLALANKKASSAEHPLQVCSQLSLHKLGTAHVPSMQTCLVVRSPSTIPSLPPFRVDPGRSQYLLMHKQNLFYFSSCYHTSGLPVRRFRYTPTYTLCMLETWRSLHPDSRLHRPFLRADSTLQRRPHLHDCIDRTSDM